MLKSVELLKMFEASPKLQHQTKSIIMLKYSYIACFLCLHFLDFAKRQWNWHSHRNLHDRKDGILDFYKKGVHITSWAFEMVGKKSFNILRLSLVCIVLYLECSHPCTLAPQWVLPMKQNIGSFSDASQNLEPPILLHP